MSKADDVRVMREMSEARSLLAEFGARLSGYDPGVTAFFEDRSIRGLGYWGEPLSFDRVEWEWLRPLLTELRDLRAKTKATP